jgi:hypothetical protein
MRRELGLDFEPEKLPNCMNRQLDAKLSWRRSTDATISGSSTTRAASAVCSPSGAATTG